MWDIDIHCLLYKNSPFFLPLEKQMKQEKVNFFTLPGSSNCGASRLKGFLSGTSPYVGYVDHDDLIQPGIFEKIRQILSQGYDWVYTDELLIDERDNPIKPGWSSNPELYPPEVLAFVNVNEVEYCHHIIVFRRDLIRLDMMFILPQLKELAESYLNKELGRSSNHFHLKEVGYFWRQHKDNWYRSLDVTKILESHLRKEATNANVER